MPITRTVLQSLTSQTAPYTSSWLDVSGITGDFTVKIRVQSLTPGNNVRIVLEESPDGSTVVPTGAAGLVLEGGSWLPQEGVHIAIKRRDLGNLTKFGVSGGKARVNLSQIDGGTCQFEAYIES